LGLTRDSLHGDATKRPDLSVGPFCRSCGSSAYGQGCSPAVDALAEPLVELLDPEALPDGELDDEPEGALDAMPELEEEPDGALLADFSFGCCVTRSRQCVAGDTLLLALGDGLDDEDCAPAVSTVPPTNAVASSRV